MSQVSQPEPEVRKNIKLKASTYRELQAWGKQEGRAAMRQMEWIIEQALAAHKKKMER